MQRPSTSVALTIPPGTPLGTAQRALETVVFSRSSGPCRSTFLRPFAPRPLRRFDATMNALTPARSLASPRRAGLMDSFPRTSERSASNHLMGSSVAFARYPSAPTTSRATRTRVWASPFASRLATPSGRIEFVILRTVRSPPVAPHPASRRRSDVWLQTGERMSEKDLHLPVRENFPSH
jgi:hypothetical protein